MRRALALAVAALAGGCFDSLLDTPCAEGYQLEHGACRLMGPDGGSPDAATPPDSATPDDGPRPDAGPDAGLGPDAAGAPDAALPPDAFACAPPLELCAGECVDTTSDPQNCGECGNVCPTGLCVDSQCVGDIVGHIVAIGHDYGAFNAPMRRMLGNALGLGKHQTVVVGWWRGTASEDIHAAVRNAGAQGLTLMSRPFVFTGIADINATTLTGLDVVVVEPQTGDGAAAEAQGTQAKSALDDFLLMGGAVVLLDGAGTVSYRFAKGAGLYDVSGTTEVSGQVAQVTDPVDAISQLVFSPYFAASTSVTFTGAPSTVVEVSGGALAFHLSR